MWFEHADWEDELDERLRRRWSNSLMNDTKWREVWLVLAETRARFYFAYADDDRWNRNNEGSLRGPVTAEQVWERGIRDPGIGGPFLFKQILAVRIPKEVIPTDIRYPVVRNDTERLFCRLSALGRLPVSEGEHGVEIRGYA